MTQKKLLQSSIDELDRLLIEVYKDAYQDIYAMLVDMYSTIIGEGETPQVSHLYAYGRYYRLMNEIKNRLVKLGNQELDLMNNGLIDLYKKNETLMNKQFNLSTYIDEDKIKSIISSDWLGDGKTLSDRIWTNKASLIVELGKMLTNSVVTGKSIGTYSKELTEKFTDVKYWQAKRLVRTEMMHTMMQSTIDKYKEAGITKYSILAVDDDRTCEYCRSINGKEFYVDDVVWGVNIPPFHPNCRCSIKAVF